MAQTRRVPVFGSLPPCVNDSRRNEWYLQLQRARDEQLRVVNKPGDYVNYEDNEVEESAMSLYTVLNSSYNFVDYIRSREYGMKEYRSVNRYHGTRHLVLHNIFKEQPVLLQKMNKVFCSQWLNNKHIIFGTKCNQLIVYNTISHDLIQIPLIKGQVNETEHKNCGIRSLKINSSKSLLATSAYNSNEIAIYRLPDFSPVALSEGAHSNWIFDIEWLDDEFFVSGSCDTKLALWQIQDQKYEEQSDDSNGELIQPVKQLIKPKITKICKAAQKIHAITFNKQLKELITISLNGYVHIWDIERFRQKFSRKVSTIQDNICMKMKSDSSLYAVGSRSFTNLLDTRTINTIQKIPTRYDGILSLSFQDNLITMGTCGGVIVFYDIRAGKYLESSNNSNRTVVLKTSKGYVYPDENQPHMAQGFNEWSYKPAIYTHCYDYSGTRLFCAGGPLIPNLCGNYAGVWQ